MITNNMRRISISTGKNRRGEKIFVWFWVVPGVASWAFQWRKCPQIIVGTGTSCRRTTRCRRMLQKVDSLDVLAHLPLAELESLSESNQLHPRLQSVLEWFIVPLIVINNDRIAKMHQIFSKLLVK